MEIMVFTGFFLTIFLLIVIGITNSHIKKKYSSSTLVSVIIINKNHSNYLEYILNKISKFENVQEIILIQKNPVFDQEYSCDKLIQVPLFEGYNNMFNFIDCLPKISTDTVLFLDNNTIITERYLKKILEKYDTDTENMYGPNCKLCTKDGYFNYGMSQNMIHENILLTSKKVLKNIGREIKRHPKIIRLMKENTEDIVFSFFFTKLYQKFPYRIVGKYKTLTTRKQLEHLEQKKFRTDFCTLLHNE